MRKNISGFTIVELLVVIVVIAILAAITIVSYTTITSRANDTAVTSDLGNLAKKLAIANIDSGAYPDPNVPALNTIKFQASTGSYDTTKWCLSYYVSPDNQEYFVNAVSKSGATYYITHESTAPKKYDGSYVYKGVSYTSSSTMINNNGLRGLSGYYLTDKQWRQWTTGGA